ncbi:hypothetical protein CGJ09_23220 [Vibrio parahaemolyticus]|nr:hypothetical protein CGJ09_23220 [Vibrio parahaemolyticus]
MNLRRHRKVDQKTYENIASMALRVHLNIYQSMSNNATYKISQFYSSPHALFQMMNTLNKILSVEEQRPEKNVAKRKEQRTIKKLLP